MGDAHNIGKKVLRRVDDEDLSSDKSGLIREHVV